MKDFKPFRLDPINHVLLRVAEQGELIPVVITAKAFDVLHYFVDHPGRLITHEELLEALWADVAVQPEVLKGHVLAIRKAIGDDARQPRFVETQRGRGYRFIGTVESVHATPKHSQPLTSPLVGREPAWEQLNAALERTKHHQTEVVFVRGEAGIGKTALVESFLKHLRHQHALITFGRCIEGFGGVEPFYPVIEALSRLIVGDDALRMQDALIAHAPSWANLLAGLFSRERRAALARAPALSARSRVLGEFCEFLESIAQNEPVVVFLEDIHWADYSTLDLISAIARRRGHGQIMLLCSIRSDHEAERTSALRQLLEDLHLHSLCRIIELTGLSERDLAHHLGVGAHAAASPLVADLRRRSGGNPLFLGILLEHLRSAGVIRQVDGLWQAEVPLAGRAIDTPSTLRGLVESRIVRIDEESCRALEAASAVGDSFNAIVPATAAGMSAQHFEDVCEALCRAGLFIQRQPPEPSSNESSRRYAFSHSLYRDVFLMRQGPLRLAQSHALIARELERGYDTVGTSHTPFELADQFAQAKEWGKAVLYLKIALQTAKRRFAHQDALTILDQADRMAQNLPEGARAGIRLELDEDRASIYAANHDRRALDIFAGLIAVAQKLDRTDVEARAELGMAFALSWSDTSACVAHLERAHTLSQHQPNPQLRARLRLSSAIWRIWIDGWSAERAVICEANVGPLRNGRDRQIAAWGLIEYSMFCLCASRYREALETIEDSVDILVEHAIDRPEFNVFRAVWMAHLGRPWIYVFLGEWGRALAEFDVSEALFVANANRYSICTLETLRAFMYVMAGDYQSVKAICEKLGVARDASAAEPHPLYRMEMPNEIRHATLLRGAAEIGLGQPVQGIETLRSLERETRANPVIMDWYWRFLLLWLLARTLAEQNRLDDARDFADEMVCTALATEERTWQALALEVRARVALGDGDFAMALQQVEHALDIVELSGVPLAAWRVHKIAAEVYCARGEYDAAQQQDLLFHQASQQLHDSLPKGHVLRQTFLRALG